jgi:hypothetical protein
MASYPSGPATFPARADGQTIFAQHVQMLQDEIAAMQAGLLSTGLQHALWGAQALTMTGVLTPPQITADQNDYAPAGLATAFIVRLTSDAPRSITGMLAQPAGRVICLTCPNNFNLTLVNQSAASAATNRFLLPGGVNLVLPGGASAWFFYDTASALWRCISTGTPATATAPIAGKVVNTAAQSLGTASTYTTLTFNNYDFQVGGAAWVVGTPSRITIPAGTGANGMYLFGANVQSPTVAQIRVRFMKNGAVCSAEMRMGAATSIAMGINAQTLINMQPGDYMEVQAWLSAIGTVGGTVRDDMVEFFYAKQNP